MPDNKLQRSQDELLREVRRDRQAIQLAEGYEVRYWCQTFRCTEPQLRWAVREVGPVFGDIRRYLAGSKYLLN